MFIRSVVPTNIRPQPPVQILAIDILRFVAALFVLACHYCTLAIHPIDERLIGVLDQTQLPVSLASWTNFGWVGVEIFFVISGYVIAISAEQSDAIDFLRRRFLRLMPAAWICGTFTLLLLLWATDWNPPILILEWLNTITLWPLGEAVDPSYWTIGIEITFYLIVATQLRGTDKTRRLNRLALIIGFLSVGFAICVHWRLAPSTPDRFWQLLLVKHGCLFALGMTIRMAHAYGWSLWRGVCCTIFALTSVMEIRAHQYDSPLDLASLSSPQIFVFLIAIFVIVIAPRLQTMLSGSRTRSTIILLGKTTYPLYLIHRTAGSVMIGGLLTLGFGGPAAIILTTCAALGLAMMIALFIEPPVRAYAARAVFNRAPRPDSPPTAFPLTG
jgi:peptidoglycan/LPS O-acetylase OafA/YrhL